MARGDGQGPAGLGPVTGRRKGYCSGFSAPGFHQRDGRSGCADGRGRGQGPGLRTRARDCSRPHGRRHSCHIGPVAPETNQETMALSQEVQYLEQRLTGLQDRLEQIKDEKKEDLG